jgi:hypothetical protein
MGLCDTLLKMDISPNCDDPIVNGFEQNGVIINREDIDLSGSTFDAARKNVIKTLLLKAGKKGYQIKVTGKTPYTGTKTSLVAGAYRNSFNHEVHIVVLANDPDVCAGIIDGLANGTYVLVLENKYKALNKETTPGDAAYQVYGWYQGLSASAIENDKYSEDTEGGWAVTLTETKAPKSGLFLFNTDYATTKTQVGTLTAAVGG